MCILPCNSKDLRAPLTARERKRFPLISCLAANPHFAPYAVPDGLLTHSTKLKGCQLAVVGEEWENISLHEIQTMNGFCWIQANELYSLCLKVSLPWRKGLPLDGQSGRIKACLLTELIKINVFI